MDDGPDYRQQEECEAEQFEADQYGQRQKDNIERLLTTMERQAVDYREWLKRQFDSEAVGL